MRLRLLGEMMQVFVSVTRNLRNYWLQIDITFGRYNMCCSELRSDYAFVIFYLDHDIDIDIDVDIDILPWHWHWHWDWPWELKWFWLPGVSLPLDTDQFVMIWFCWTPQLKTSTSQTTFPKNILFRQRKNNRPLSVESHNNKTVAYP